MKAESDSAYGLFATLWLSSAGAAMQLLAAITLATLILDSKLFLYIANVGAFIAGLGTGTLWESHSKRTTKKEMAQGGRLLAQLQFRTTTLAAVVLPLGAAGAISLDYLRRTQDFVPFALEALIIGTGTALLAAFLGFTTGRQLPIISSVLKKRGAGSESFRYLFGLDYIGCALGAILFLLWFYPQFGWVRALSLATLCSILGNVLTLTLLGLSPRTLFPANLLYLCIALGAWWQGPSLENIMDNRLFGF